MTKDPAMFCSCCQVCRALEILGPQHRLNLSSGCDVSAARWVTSRCWFWLPEDQPNPVIADVGRMIPFGRFPVGWLEWHSFILFGWIRATNGLIKQRLCLYSNSIFHVLKTHVPSKPCQQMQTNFLDDRLGGLCAGLETCWFSIGKPLVWAVRNQVWLHSKPSNCWCCLNTGWWFYSNHFSCSPIISWDSGLINYK